MTSNTLHFFSQKLLSDLYLLKYSACEFLLDFEQLQRLHSFGVFRRGSFRVTSGQD